MKLYLETEDFSVSGEKFQLVHDEELDMLKTHPRPEELESYYQSASYISHSDADRTFTEKLYQAVKKFSLWVKVRMIARFVHNKNKSLLDVGAGTGDFLVQAKNTGWFVNGVEPSLDARLKSREKKVELVSSLEDVKGQKFQVITLWHVLEHLPNLESDIEKLNLLLEENGTLVIAVPNFKSFDADHYQEFWAAYDVPRHLWHFSSNAIKEIFAKHGFGLIKRKPMWFDAFYVSLLSEKYKTGKQNFLRAFYIGTRSNIMGLLTGEFSSAIYILRKL
ncbi:class I SAM-dependent methyltransferase [Cytophaga sp. FL35]|uniref:class I SAM-dependent methyltransferase n=1 Tax=Cytophaga sp. FL35 TaxID=1904456 RepID=UPI001653EC89|nr:class I SAM-dependent methyltransferase [Cytophaga sp. FL35]MBC6997574.1 class I SAM-dependent methyltransferase [Cytophaga sp. FL35]